jgi:formyl-CoA transferase
LQQFEAAGVPCGRVNYRSDMYTDPQAQALGLVWELENRDIGKYKASGHPIRFSETPVRPTKGSPALAEHSDSILKEFGFSETEIVALKTRTIVK